MKSAPGRFTCTHLIQHVLSQLKHKFSWHLIDIQCKKGKGLEQDIFSLNISKITLSFTPNAPCGHTVMAQSYLE